MKVLVSKDFGEDKPSNDTINEFMEATSSALDKITLFFDRGSRNSDDQHPDGNFSFIGLDFEERNEALSIAVKQRYNKNVRPSCSLTEKVFQKRI